MPIPTLASALRAKQKASNLSIAALAKVIGVSPISATAALKGKSTPNATTAPKCAKFLGMTMEEFGELVKPVAKAPVAKPTKKVRAAKPISIADAVELAGDALAVAVHRATVGQRKVVEAVLEAE